jgi:hypothetical protein
MAFTYKENDRNLTVFSNDLTNKGHSQHQYRLLANSIFNAASVKRSEAATEFMDLKEVELWAGNDIRALAAQRVLQGKSGQLFEPLTQVTRAEFLTMLVRALGLAEQKSKISYIDVPSSSWYYPYVTTAAARKLVEGVGEDRLEPDRAITREEMAQLAANAFKLTQDALSRDADESLGKFDDKDSIAPYAREAVALLSEANIMQGTSLSVFEPQQAANRAQAAVLINRLKNYNRKN